MLSRKSLYSFFLASGLTLSLLIFAAACTQKSGKVTEMPPMEAMGMLRNDFAVLVDVRETDEQKAGMAEGAISMPSSKIKAGDPEWQKFKSSLSKDKKIIFYGASDAGAKQTAEKLAAEGYQTALIGGFQDWVSAGLPIKKPQ